MPAAFKEDDVLAIDIPGTSTESADETCSVSYDDEGRIVLIVNNTSGLKEFRAYYQEYTSDSFITLQARVVRTFFDKDNNFLLSGDIACQLLQS